MSDEQLREAIRRAKDEAVKKALDATDPTKSPEERRRVREEAHKPLKEFKQALRKNNIRIIDENGDIV